MLPYLSKDTQRTSSRVCDLCNPRDYRAMRLLESLTPNGSEFVNDPEACVEFVRDRLDFVIRLAKERKALRSKLEAALLIAEKPFESNDKAEIFEELMQCVADIKEALQ